MKLTSILLVAAAILAPASLQAQTVAWGTSVSINTDGSGTLRLSNGTQMPTNLTWAIGYFGDVTPGVPYVPTASNYSTWNLNWISIATGTPFPVTTNPVNTDQNVSVNTTNVGTAAAGKLGYMWAYSDINAMGVPGTEAFLATETDWIFPSIPNSTVWDIADNLLSSADNNMNVIWGRVDRVADAAGGLLQGGGTFSSLLPDSNSPNFDAVTFEVQSATWPALPVPEPSSTLLAALSGILLLGRRNRRK
jgi:hypothetical protein